MGTSQKTGIWVALYVLSLMVEKLLMAGENTYPKWMEY
jgi:hypothetical protein